MLLTSYASGLQRQTLEKSGIAGKGVWEYNFAIIFTYKYIKINFFIFKKLFFTLIYNRKAFETQMTSHSLHQAYFNELAEILQANSFL